MKVYRTGEVLSVPVGDAYMGRVVNPLGEPIDNLGEIEDEGRRALELQAPGVTDGNSVQEPPQTARKPIDARFPTGRGTRHRIIVNRQPAKTTTGVDACLN